MRIDRAQCRLVILMLVAILTAPVARAQDNTDYFAAAAEVVGPISGTKNAAPVLFDAMAEMEHQVDLNDGFMPLEQYARLLLKTADDPDWPTLRDWAAAEPQQAVIEAVATVGELEEKYQLSIPLGSERSEQKYVDANLYVRIGPTGLLADMHPIYGSRLDEVFFLLSVEAMRLCEEEDGEGALEVLVDALHLSHLLADRPFMVEKRRGMLHMLFMLERLRDAFFFYPDIFDDRMIRDLLTDDLDERTLGERLIRLPEGDFLAARQLIQQTVTYRGGPNDRFSEYLGVINAGDRPLMAFQEAAHWRDVAAGHAGWYDLQDQLGLIIGDWRKRWGLANLNDPIHRNVTDFQKTDPGEYAMLMELLDPVEEIFWLRTRLYIEAGGTRTALGVLGFEYNQRQLPRTSKAIQPRFRTRLDEDVFAWDERKLRYEPFQFFVPIRDVTWGPRDVPGPHTMTIYSIFLDPSYLLDNVGYSTFPMALEGAPYIPQLQMGPGMAAGGDPMMSMIMAQAMQSVPQEEMDEFTSAIADLPDGAFNWETFEADLPAIRDALLEAIRETDISSEELAEFNEMFTQGIPGVNEDVDDLSQSQLESLLYDIWSKELAPLARASGLEETAGVSFEQIDKLVRAISTQVGRQSETKEVLRHLIDAEPMDRAGMKSVSSALVGVILSEEVWAEVRAVWASLRQGPMGEMITGVAQMMQSGGLTFEQPSVFDFSVDDSEFILYSKGFDSVASRVESSHALYGDVLIWPPTLSLTKLYLDGVTAIEGDDD